MFRHKGFRERWTADFTRGIAAGKGPPRAVLDASGAPIRWGLLSAAALAAKEAEGGQEYAVGTKARLLIQDSRRSELITRLPKDLVPDVPGTKVTLVLDAASALDGMRVEEKRAWVPFDLGLPTGAAMHYQPPLTPAEVDEGCFRPPLIVGSFAVYGPADGGTGHWDVGKLGHLYRPFLFDSGGAWTWCDWALERGALYAVLPLDWLGSTERKWPVLLDPTFGHDGTPGTSSSWGLNYCVANGSSVNGFTAPATGTISGLAVVCNHDPASQITMGIFSDNTKPNVLLADTVGGVTPLTKAWSADQALDGPYGMTSGEKLWLACQLGGSGIPLYRDTVAGAKYYYGSAAYAHGAITATPGTGSSNEYLFGFRATYEAAGGGAPGAVRRRYMMMAGGGSHV